MSLQKGKSMPIKALFLITLAMSMNALSAKESIAFSKQDFSKAGCNRADEGYAFSVLGLKIRLDRIAKENPDCDIEILRSIGSQKEELSKSSSILSDTIQFIKAESGASWPAKINNSTLEKFDKRLELLAAREDKLWDTDKVFFEHLMAMLFNHRLISTLKINESFNTSELKERESLTHEVKKVFRNRFAQENGVDSTTPLLSKANTIIIALLDSAWSQSNVKNAYGPYRKLISSIIGEAKHIPVYEYYGKDAIHEAACLHFLTKKVNEETPPKEFLFGWLNTRGKACDRNFSFDHRIEASLKK